MTAENKKHYPIRRAKRQERPYSDPQGGKRRYGAAKKPGEEEEVPAGQPRRERRALSHVGGEVHFQGGREEEHDALAQALNVSAEEDQVMSDVHGFHSYPARLHPKTARSLIEGFSKPGDRILDPFCGSGTVVVEGRALGREAIGSDLNPLAVELSWIKSRGPTKKVVADMVHAAASISELADERRIAKADPFKRYSPEDRERYPIHILLELDSLAHGIGLLGKTDVARMLRLVVSSMLTKLSHSEGDTTRQRAPRRLPSGFAIQLFHKKTEELAQRLNDYRSRLADRAPRAYIGCSDARDLENVESDSINLIVTSPPYPGVYDYLDHHLHRIEWLGLRAAALQEGEIGARRRYNRMTMDQAAAQWRSEIGPTLQELKRILTPDGRGIMIIADSVVDRSPLYADEQIRRVADRAGIEIICIASQERPLFLHGAERAFSRRPRLEHVVVFRKKEKQRRQERENDEKLQELSDDIYDRTRPARFRKFDTERLRKSDQEKDREQARRGSGGGGRGGSDQRYDRAPRRDGQKSFKEREERSFQNERVENPGSDVGVSRTKPSSENEE